MSPEVRAAIEENKALIEAEDWENLYRKLGETQAIDTIGKVSQALLSAGVDPLEGSKKIPQYFFAMLPITSYEVPDGIEIIGASAFVLCEELKEVTLPKTIKIIQSGAFMNAHKLNKIIFQGTKAKWEKILKGPWWSAGTDKIVIEFKN